MRTPTEAFRAAPRTGVLPLLYLASPSLPIGAYAYSQGLEAAVSAGSVHDAATAADWVHGLLHELLVRADLPILARMHAAWSRDDLRDVGRWSDELIAQRESRELQAEDLALGRALARLLRDLGIERASHLLEQDPEAPGDGDISPSHAGAFALAAVEWSIPCFDAACGYAYAWAENQLAAATRLIPLGQTEARRALLRILDEIEPAATAALTLSDADLGAAAPGLALFAAAHETQYTRLFRS